MVIERGDGPDPSGGRHPSPPGNPQETEAREPGLGRVAPAAAHPPVTPEQPAPVETDADPSLSDSDWNDEQDYQLAEAILKAAGWDPAAIAGRLEYHWSAGTLDEFLERLPTLQEALEKSEPEVRAKVDALELELEL